jgi:hypothetical protein
MSTLFGSLTVSALDYQWGVTVTQKTVDQYFCWVVGVEWRVPHVIDVTR